MIAVTGANGLLGSFIVRKLIEQKLPFVAIKRKASDTSLLRDVNNLITWKDAEVTDEVALQEVFDGVTTVIHAAAIVSFNPRMAKQVMHVNVQGTHHVVNACLTKGIKRLLHVSSVAALGRQKDQRVIQENNMWVNSPLNSVYGESKYQAELEVFRGQEEGLSTVVINPSVILAPADWERSSAQIFKYVWNERPFYTDGFINCVDVRDVVEIIFRLLNAPVEAQRFVVNAGNLSFEQLFTHIANEFDCKPPSVKLSKTLLKVAARVEAVRTLFTNSEPLITRETARLSGTEFFYDNNKIKQLLGFQFQPIETTINWCCQQYLTKMRTEN